MSIKKKLYETLGIDKNASSEEVKAAYRKQAKKHHPDAGGDSDKFSELSKAYLVLSDKKKRQQYDETGDWDDKASIRSPESEARKILATIFESLLSHPDVRPDIDLKRVIIDTLENRLKEGLNVVNGLHRRKQSIQAYHGNIVRTSEGENIFEKIIKNLETQIDSNLEDANEKINILDLAIKEMKNYESGFSPMSALGAATTNTSSFSWR